MAGEHMTKEASTALWQRPMAPLLPGTKGVRFQQVEPLKVQNIQRKAEVEAAQHHQNYLSLQREEEEEEPVQASLQRKELEEEEPVQTFLQREADEEEEPVQTYLQRETEEEEEPVQMAIQREASGLEPEATSASIGQRIHSRRGQGYALPVQLHQNIETHLGSALPRITIHTDSEADALSKAVSAKAFTTGSDIFFRQGAYDPGSSEGQKLIAHEATHVLQQSRGPVSGVSMGGGVKVSEPSDSFEQEAVSVGNKFEVSSDLAPVQEPSIQLKPQSEFVLQRDPPATAPVGSASASPASPGLNLGSVISRAALEEARGQATARAFRLGAFSQSAMSAVDNAKSRLVQFSGTYTRAYGQYSTVVRAARSEAQNQQDWINIFAGIAIGTGVGLLAELIVPVAIEEAATISLANIGWGALGEAAEAGVAGAVNRSGLLQVAGTDLEPGGIHPGVLGSQIWQRLADLYQSIARIQQLSWHLPLLTGNIEYVLGQLRLIESGGQADMSQEELLEFSRDLVGSNQTMRALDSAIEQRGRAIARFSQGVAAATPYTERELLQDIWILWMSELSNGQSDILDLDSIEDHLHSIGVLGSESRLGVDFGLWTSEDDELEALAAARREARAIRSRIAASSGG